MKNTKTRKLVVLAMFAALAFIAVICIRIPIVSVEFLKFEPKDVIITIAGFMYGPLSSLAISVVVSLLEMVTISSTGIIGLIMNVLSTCAFSCVAALIYKKRHDIAGAAIGLASGTLVMTAMMLLWNYAITPLYMGNPREAVAAMLMPVFLPFNLLKGGLNTALTLMLYKPVVSILRKAKLLEVSGAPRKKKIGIGTIITSVVLLCTCILIILAMNKII